MTLNFLTLILASLELDYGFKDHDLMLMDDFMMFICTLECWNQLGMIGTSLRNYYEKVGKERGFYGSWRFERRGAPEPVRQTLI